MEKFKPTHVISIEGQTDLIVGVVDGVAYTVSEWETGSTADYAIENGEWLFQGQAFAGEITSLVRGKKVTVQHGKRTVLNTDFPIFSTVANNGPSKWILTKSICNGIADSALIFTTRSAALLALAKYVD